MATEHDILNGKNNCVGFFVNLKKKKEIYQEATGKSPRKWQKSNLKPTVYFMSKSISISVNTVNYYLTMRLYILRAEKT